MELAEQVRAWAEAVAASTARMSSRRPLFEVLGIESVLRHPASEQEIMEGERRLGRAIPESYRAFLRISNGALASDLGPVLYGDADHTGFVPVDEVRPVHEVSPLWVELWCREFEGVPHESPSPGSGIEVGDFSAGADALVISNASNGLFMNLLVQRSDLGTFEVWSTHKEGASAYSSFGDLLSHATARLVTPHRRSLSELEDLMVQPHVNRNVPLSDIAELSQERGEYWAELLLADATARWWEHAAAAAVLGRMVELGYTPDLRLVRALAESTSEASATALEVLAQLGEAEALIRLRSLADGPDGPDAWRARGAIRSLRPPRGPGDT